MYVCEPLPPPPPPCLFPTAEFLLIHFAAAAAEKKWYSLRSKQEKDQQTNWSALLRWERFSY